MSYGYIPFSKDDLPDGYVVPRDASTIMVVRDHGTLEVLMLKRSAKVEFAGGAHVFPGGSLDEDDFEISRSDRCTGRLESKARDLLGIDQDALAFWVCAIRECFEESGLLFARDPSGNPISLEDPKVKARFGGYREKLNNGEISFSQVCEAEDLTLALDELCYFSHWITPEGVPKRFDTRFFVALAPEGQQAHDDGSETVSSVWINPTRAIELGEAGEIQLIFATIRNLEALGRFEGARALLDAARAIDSVPANLPRVLIDGREIRILLPGDEGYEDLVG